MQMKAAWVVKFQKKEKTLLGTFVYYFVLKTVMFHYQKLNNLLWLTRVQHHWNKTFIISETMYSCHLEKKIKESSAKCFLGGQLTNTQKQRFRGCHLHISRQQANFMSLEDVCPEEFMKSS